VLANSSWCVWTAQKQSTNTLANCWRQIERVCRLFLHRSHTPTWVCQHEFDNFSLPCEGSFRCLSDLVGNSQTNAFNSVYAFSCWLTTWASINQRQTLSMHNTNRHCRVRFHAFVGAVMGTSELNAGVTLRWTSNPSRVTETGISSGLFLIGRQSSVRVLSQRHEVAIQNLTNWKFSSKGSPVKIAPSTSYCMPLNKLLMLMSTSKWKPS